MICYYMKVFFSTGDMEIVKRDMWGSNEITWQGIPMGGLTGEKQRCDKGQHKMILSTSTNGLTKVNDKFSSINGLSLINKENY